MYKNVTKSQTEAGIMLQELVETLADDPLLTNILFAILRNPGITAREIKRSLPKLKGTSIYYYLNSLAEKEFVKAESKLMENRNLIQKMYRVHPDLFSDKFVNDMRTGKDRNSALMSLFLAQQFINNQIHKILQMDDLSFSEFAEQEQIKTISGFALEKQISKDIVEKYDEIYPLLQKESSTKLGNTFGERAQQGDRFFFICNLPYD